MWRDLKHTLTRFVTISHIPSPKTSSTSPCNCNEARKEWTAVLSVMAAMDLKSEVSSLLAKKKKEKKGGRKEVDGIHRKEPQKDG